MHEYSVTKRIVKIINGAAAEHRAERVKTAFLVIGENTCIIPESVQMYFDMIAKGTPSEGAVLKVRAVKAEMRCPSCGKNFIRPRFSFECPVCGALGSPTDVGNECYVERVELFDNAL
ncbi:MAG: hydrogenase maturation nickel metallochaperone HypA [Oscillospiraceae bacterium]|nr:hydrogenase maturation nickel metallochaperone HypA [Oscillospiraceae bacterium]